VYKVAFDKDAEKEFLKLDTKVQKLVSLKILDLQSGKFRKRAGDYRIIYLKENNYLVRIVHRKEVY